MKQTVEEALGKENVVIDINQMSSDDLNNITYYASNAAAEDWDISNGDELGDQITKIHLLIWIFLRQQQVRTLRHLWDLMIQIVLLLLKLV